MALQGAYKQFLAAPNPTLLAENTSLHYITSLTSFTGRDEVLKHLEVLAKQINKKSENVLDTVEGTNALVVEVEVTMEFKTGGGVYLPNLDDNFLVDRTVIFPIIHFVTFDGNGLISQIRQNWDQGSLLKSIDVIGKTGRNWPIRDGKDQIKLIVSSVKNVGKPADVTATKVTKDVNRSHTSSVTSDDYHKRSRENSTNVTRDPHASLHLFSPHEESAGTSLPAVIAARASAKPAARNYHDLFVGEDPTQAASPSPAARERPASPHKHSAGVAPKGGNTGKNFQPSRLFEDTDENSPIRPKAANDHSAESFYKPHPKKYQHFDFGEGQDAPVKPVLEKKTSKHASTWDFDDFNTPAKPVPTKVLRAQDVTHWAMDDAAVENTPVMVKKVDKPRKDAETHFELVDDGTSEGAKKLVGRPRGAGMNTGLGLYKNSVYGEEANAATPPTEKPLANIVNMKDRRKDFDAHFSMTDEFTPIKDSAAVRGPLSENTNANATANQGIKIAGDGMGSAKLGDGKGVEGENVIEKGIRIGGDGMGGRKATDRSWGLGDDLGDGGAGGEEGGLRKNAPGKKLGAAHQMTGSGFWDF